MRSEWDNFVAAWKSIGLTMEEVSDVVKNWTTQIVEDIEGHEVDEEADASNGMTLDELIPETIAEWRQLKDEL